MPEWRKGKRGSLKNCWEKSLEGSSPSSGTSVYNHECRQKGLEICFKKGTAG